MNHKNEIRVGVKFETDNSQLDISRQKFKELMTFLKDIQDDARQPGLGTQMKKELIEAAQEAKKLENILNSAWNEKLNKMDFSKFNLSIKQSYGSMSQLKASLESAGPSGASAFNQLSNAILSSNTQLRKTNNLLDKMSLTMANTIRFGISSSIFNNFTGSISKAYGYVQKLDKSLNDIRIVSGASAEQMDKFAKYANNAAKSLGSSTLDYTNAALIYYQQGLAEQQVQERADITVKMSNVLGKSAEEVSNYMTAIWNNFDNGSKSLEYYADVLAKLGAETASSAEEISQGLEKFAAVSDTVGLSYEYAAAALTTVTDRTRQSADVVGTAFKTLFARIQDLELGKTLDDGTTLGKYSEALESIGVNIKDQNGQLKSMDTILDEMGSKWKTLNNDQKVALAQNVAGVRQYTQLMSLMENWDFFQQNVDSARNATGALQQQQEIYLDSVEAHLEQLRTEAEKTYATLFDVKLIKTFTDALSGMLKVFNSFLTGLGGGLSSLSYFGSLAGNLLNKQIGSGISGMIQNQENKNYNASKLEASKQIANAGIANSSDEGQNTKNAYQANLDDVTALINAHAALDEESFNKFDTIRKEIAEERLEIAKIKDFGENSSKNSDQREADLAIQKKQVKEDVENYNILKDLIKETNDIEVKYKEELQEKEEILKRIVHLIEEINGTTARDEEIFSSEEVKELEKITKRLSGNAKNIKITEDEKNKILKAQNKVIIANAAEEKRQNEELQIQKQWEDKIGLKKKEQLNTEKQAQYAMDVTEKSRAAMIADITKGLTSVTSSITAIIGITETLFNPDLSGWEKFKSILMVVATQTFVLWKNWDSIKSLPGNLITSLEAYNKKLEMGIKIKKASKAASLAEAGATEANTIAQNKNTQSKIANTGAEVINEGTKKKSIITTIIHTAKLWLENAALATKLFLIGAVAVALIALTVAIVKAVSKENQLQKKINETAEAAKKAKEAYNELNDKITSYQDARNAINGLTEGTLEFYEAVVKSNEAAQELIDNLGLMVGKDYTFDTNGLITINEDSLKNKAYTQMQQVYGTQAANYQARANYTEQSSVGGLEGVYKSLALDINKTLKENGQKDYKWTSEMAKSLLKGEDIQTEIKGELISLKQGVQNIDDSTATTCDLIKPIDISEAMAQNKAAYEKLSAELLNYQRMTADYYIRGTVSQEDGEYYNNLTKGIQKQIQTIVAQSIFSQEESYQQEKGKLLRGGVAAASTVLPGPGRAMGLSNPQGWNALIEGTRAKANVANIDKTAADWYVKNVLNAESLKKGKYKYNGEEYSSSQKLLKNNDIDLEVARNAYYTDQTFQRVSKIERNTRSASLSAGLNSDQADYVSEARLALETAKTSGTATNKSGPGVKNDFKYNKIDFQDWNAISPEEMKVLEKQIETGFGTSQLEAFKKYLKEIGYEFDETARKASDLQKYNDAMDIQAQSVGASTSALKIYDAARQKAENGIISYTKSQAENAAAEYKFNKAYNAGRKTFKENEDAFKAYTKALKNHNKVSYDVADGAGAIVDSLKDMGLELSTEDLKDPKALKQIKTLLSGTAEEAEKAYKELEKRSLGNLLAQDFGVAKDEIDNVVKAIQSLGKGETTLGDLGLGKVSGTAEEIRQKLANLGLKVNEEDLARAKQQVADINSGKGSTAEIKSTSVSEPVVSTITQSGRWSIDSDGNRTKLPDLTWTETKQANDVKFTLGKDARVTYTGKPKNFTPSPATTNKGKGGGGSSSKKKEEKSKNEVDRYHVVNTQISKVDNSLKKLQKQEERSLGKDLLDNLGKQWQNLEKQVDNYKEKLKIAQGEYRELQKELNKKGIKFNADGTVANYFEVLQAQEKELNKIIDKYNKMSAKQQEKYQKTLDAAKENFEKFKTNLDRIDTLASNEIPQIAAALRDTIDEEIETNIKAFSLEVDLSLDLKEAQKEWNDFRHKIVNGLRDEDILGNARLTQDNLGTLVSRDQDGNYSGDLVNQIEHVQEIMNEIQKQKDNQENVYGDNTKAALDDLKKYFDEAKNSYEEAVGYQKELHQDYLDMLDQAKEKLDEQIDNYDQITDLLEHDKRLVELTYGEKAYAILEKYYKLQKQNNKDELTTLKAQQDFYRRRLDSAQAEMIAAKEALKEENLSSDEYEKRNSKYLETVEKFNKTKEQWEEAVSRSNEALEKSIEDAQTQLENTINLINQTMAQNLTGKNGGLEYAEEEWDLINRNADQYLDTINRLQGQNDLESKYLDSINKATNPSVQKKLKNAMDSEMKSLREKDKLTQYDLDRANKRYQIMLAQIALEEAQQNKNKMRLRRDSQGNYRYQYVADEDNIQKAKDELSTLYTDLYNFDKERYKSTLSEVESITKEFQDRLAELSKINDPKEREEQELLIRQQYQQLFTAVQAEAETARLNLTDSAFDDLALLYDEDKNKYISMTEEETNALMGELVPAWNSVNAAIAQNLEPLNFVNDAINQQKEAWDATQIEIEEYLKLLDRSKEEIKQAVNDIGESTDTNIQKVEEFIGLNQDLIDTYDSNLNSLQNMINSTDELINNYLKESKAIDTLVKSFEKLETQMKSNSAVYDDYAKKPSLVTDPQKGKGDETPSGGTQEKEEEEPIIPAEPAVESKPNITNSLPSSTKLTKGQKKTLQRFLNNMGYNAGTVDGVWGKNSKAALKRFQSKIGTSQDGTWGPKTWKAAKAAGYDTGGYTGEWGNNGRLAFLHQKELVLNAQDTENILNTVAIMRNLMASMNESILSRLAGVTAGSIQGLDSIGNNSGLEQNVHIEANFPNATSSNEIEEALRNLVNVASQRVTK